MDEDSLRSLIASMLRVPQDHVTRDADLVCDLGADSLSLAEISGVIERETRKPIPVNLLPEIMTVGDLEDLVFRMQADHVERTGDS